MQEKYQCHICMQVAQKPIVTPCGHLFCWHCIYHWLRSNQEYLTCPLCKSGLELSSTRPILLKNQPPQKQQGGIPARPRHFVKVQHRLAWQQIPKCILGMGMNIQRGVLLAGYGIFPSVYQCLFHHYQAPLPIESNGEHSVQHKPYHIIKNFTTLLALLLLVLVVII